MNTIIRWIVLSSIATIISIIIWVQIPSVINGDLWWAGFLVEAIAVGSWIAFGITIASRLAFAEKLRSLLENLEIEAGFVDLLDVPPRSMMETKETIVDLMSEGVRKSDIIHVLKNRK